MIKTNRAVVVEGKYDKSHLENIIEALIITTDGFNLKNDVEKQLLIKRLARESGLLVLTDSDYAGMQIRRYVGELAGQGSIVNAYVPDIHGKEKRKQKPSSDGILGVEGILPELIEKAVLEALASVGEICPNEQIETVKKSKLITKADLFEAQIIGTDGCSKQRRELLEKLGLPTRLSTNQMLELLNRVIGREKFYDILSEK